MYVFYILNILPKNHIICQFDIYSPNIAGVSEEIQCLCDFDGCNLNSDPDPDYVAGARQVNDDQESTFYLDNLKLVFRSLAPSSLLQL